MSDTASVIEIAALSPGENRFHLSPDEQARAAIAERLGEPGVEALSGDFVIEPFRGGVMARLRVAARVNRLCVASLEPMTEVIDERYAIRFERNYAEDIELENAAGEIAHEPLEGDALDLDELLIQHLALSLSSHPRKGGASSLAETYKDPVILSPFAGLKGIVDGDA